MVKFVHAKGNFPIRTIISKIVSHYGKDITSRIFKTRQFSLDHAPSSSHPKSVQTVRQKNESYARKIWYGDGNCHAFDQGQLISSILHH